MTSRISPYRCPNCESKDFETTQSDYPVPVDHDYRCDACGERFDERKDMRDKDPDYWLKPQA